MKILFIADLHIKLGQKTVPKDFQYNRFIELANELNLVECDKIVIAGDLLDVAKPSVEELGLMYEFLSLLDKEKILIPGNHEMVTKTKDCYIPLDGLMKDLNCLVLRDFTNLDGIDYIPYNILHKKEWPKAQSNFCVTHVRGEIPPHVTSEIDLERFSSYEKVFAGDLHSYKNTQGNLYYPGSPFSTSFHRNIPSGSNGFFIIDTNTGSHTWHELYLPQLIRKTVSDPKEMVATKPHHTIYELEGDLDELAKIEKSELLDKKITKNAGSPATLSLSGSISDELAIYLKKIKKLPERSISRLISRFKEVHTYDSD